MTAQELDGWLRGQLEQLDQERPGTARPAYFRERYEQALAGFTAAVAGRTGLAAGYVGELLARREVIRQASPHERDTLAEAADTGFVSAVIAAAAWTAAAARPRSTREKAP